MFHVETNTPILDSNRKLWITFIYIGIKKWVIFNKNQGCVWIIFKPKH